jgi:hypothetical protein
MPELLALGRVVYVDRPFVAALIERWRAYAPAEAVVGGVKLLHAAVISGSVTLSMVRTGCDRSFVGRNLKR